LGLLYATVAYNIYIASLACYVAQVDTPPPSFRAMEERRARRLRTLLLNAPRWDRRAVWHYWYARNPFSVLHQAQLTATAMDCSPQRIMTTIAGDEQRPWPQTVLRRIRSKFQSALTKRMRELTQYDAQGRMREKLRRWDLPVWRRYAAARATRRLQSLPRLVPPRVAAAVLGTVWNEWAAARRLQIEGPANRCVLGYRPAADDSLEHYTGCPLVRQAAFRHLRITLRGWPHALSDFLMVRGQPTVEHLDDERTTRPQSIRS